MNFILGKRIEMSQKFQDDGTVVPVTLIQAGPCVVSQLKNKEKDGYEAVQIGFGAKKRVNKPLKGHLKDLGDFRYLREFPVDKSSDYKKGQNIDISIFKTGDKVKVTGITKGKGFQGVVKRYGFKGSPASHGHKDQLRMPGSAGATGPQRVLKGKKMPGRMGGDRQTTKNLEVVEVDKEKNIIAIKGAVPGARNGLVLITSNV